MWEQWNNNLQSQHKEFLGFDGIDWDLEGRDGHTYDTINHTVLNLVGEMSQVNIISKINENSNRILFFENC